MNASNRTIHVMLAVWGACVIGAFWQYEWRYLRPVGRPRGAMSYDLTRRTGVLPNAPLSVLDTDDGPAALHGPIAVTLLNFWSPTCACSRFTESHVRALVEDPALCRARFITIVECGRSAAAQREALAAWRARSMPPMPAALDPGGNLARAFGVWAAPGAVILDREGHIAYLGSYNAARFCADPATAWAREALQALLAGQSPMHPRTPFYGCQVAGAL